VKNHFLTIRDGAMTRATGTTTPAIAIRSIRATLS
jgi:hypothetical protein